MQGRQRGMRGGKGDLFGKRSPFPPDPQPFQKLLFGRYGSSPSGGHRAWHRALPSGEALGTRWHLSRRPAWTQWSVRGRRGMEGEQRTSFLPEDHAGAQTALLWSRLCVWEGGGSVCQPFFHGSFPKKQKSLCPRRDTGRESAFGEGRGEFEGGREPLCALAKGVPFPPQQNHCYRA